MTEKSQDNVFAPLAPLENDINVFINNGKYSLRTAFKVAAAVGAALVPPVLGWLVDGPVGGAVGGTVGGLIGMGITWVLLEKQRRLDLDAEIAAKNMEAEEELSALQQAIDSGDKLPTSFGPCF